MIRNDYQHQGPSAEEYREDIRLLAQFIREAIEERYATQRLLSKGEAADVLGVSERTIDRYREKGKIAWVDMEGTVCFEKDDLWDFIRSRKVKKGQPNTRADFEERYNRYAHPKKSTPWRK